MKTFAKKIQELKAKNADLINFKVVWSGKARLTLMGEWIDEGKSEGFYDAGTIAYFYIPTEKGYMSAEWKNSNFNTLIENPSDEFISNIMPFIQDNEPTIFVRPTIITTAHAVAAHINKNGGDPYNIG